MDIKLSNDDGYRTLAARFLRKQAKRLASQLDGSRTAHDSESIHQARVASRRLRAAMRLFDGCFDAEQSAGWTKEIRRITGRLGNARDLDVQTEFLGDVLATIDEPACYPGIASLLAKLQRQRDRQQPKVIEAADRFEASSVLKEIRAATKKILVKSGAGGNAGQPSPVLLAHARRHVVERIAALRSHEDCLVCPEAVASHHAMRIDAKRLRYTMEILAPVFAGRLAEPIKAIKRAQTLLGDIHDCDVWVERLASFAAKQRKRIEKVYGPAGPVARHEIGLECLQQRQRQRRERVFGELVAYWRRLIEERFWERLEMSLGASESRPREIESSAESSTEPHPASMSVPKPAQDSSRPVAFGQATLHGPHPTSGPTDAPAPHPPVAARKSARKSGSS